MSRSQSSDPLAAYRFHAKLIDTEPYAGSINDGPGIDGGEAGFTDVTGGEVSIDAVEYREGLDIWTKKFPGVPTTNTITMSRGLVLRDTDLFEWFVANAEGREYRADLVVYSLPRVAWRRDAADAGRVQAAGLRDGWTRKALGIVYREAWCSRVKFPDMDATNTEISKVEAEVVFEYPELLNPPEED